MDPPGANPSPPHTSTLAIDVSNQVVPAAAANTVPAAAPAYFVILLLFLILLLLLLPQFLIMLLLLLLLLPLLLLLFLSGWGNKDQHKERWDSRSAVPSPPHRPTSDVDVLNQVAF